MATGHYCPAADLDAARGGRSLYWSRYGQPARSCSRPMRWLPACSDQLTLPLGMGLTMRWTLTRSGVLTPILDTMPWPSILAAFLTPIFGFIVTRAARAAGRQDLPTTRWGELATHATTWVIAWVLVQLVMDRVAPHRRQRVLRRLRGIAATPAHP
jgi:hypothetical protein